LKEPLFPGYIDIIDPYGISVISDIDDTIKVTDVLDGKDAILQNTFFRTAVEVPHMNEVYSNWANEGAHVHYVSNSPWQVYPALSEFITEKKFPQGSMHLRAVSTQDLIIGKPGKHKLEVIPKIIKDFPNRKFILVGDSGEIDPEV
jgi:phosphatidate phosphatase APP1